MPKKIENVNAPNPFDKHAPRTKRFAIAVNDYDLFEIACLAKKSKMTKTEYARFCMSLPLDVRVGAPQNNKNARRLK